MVGRPSLHPSHRSFPLLKDGVGEVGDPGGLVFLGLVPVALRLEKGIVVGAAGVEDDLVEGIDRGEMITRSFEQEAREKAGGSAVSIGERVDGEEIAVELGGGEERLILGARAVTSFTKGGEELFSELGRNGFDELLIPVSSELDVNRLELQFPRDFGFGGVEHPPMKLLDEVWGERIRLAHRPKVGLHLIAKGLHPLLQFGVHVLAGLGKGGNERLQILGPEALAFDLGARKDGEGDGVKGLALPLKGRTLHARVGEGLDLGFGFVREDIPGIGTKGARAGCGNAYAFNHLARTPHPLAPSPPEGRGRMD